MNTLKPVNKTQTHRVVNTYMNFHFYLFCFFLLTRFGNIPIYVYLCGSYFKYFDEFYRRKVTFRIFYIHTWRNSKYSVAIYFFDSHSHSCWVCVDKMLSFLCLLFPISYRLVNKINFIHSWHSIHFAWHSIHVMTFLYGFNWEKMEIWMRLEYFNAQTYDYKMQPQERNNNNNDDVQKKANLIQKSFCSQHCTIQ